MKNFFDLIAPVYEKIRPDAEKVFHVFTSMVEFMPSDVVVDIGGGSGALAKFIVGKVNKITVIDSSEKMLEQCRKHSGVVCMNGRAENLPLQNDSVDKVIIADAFHHFPDQAKAIQEIRRVLKPGGAAVLAEFNPGTFGGRLIVLLEYFLRLGSVFYRPQKLADLFSRQNFKTLVSDEGKKDYYLVCKKN